MAEAVSDTFTWVVKGISYWQNKLLTPLLEYVGGKALDNGQINLIPFFTLSPSGFEPEFACQD